MRRIFLPLCLVCLITSAHAVVVGVSESCLDRGSVNWSERLQKGGQTKVTLKAEAAEGSVFSRWSLDEATAQIWPADVRYGGSQTVTVSTNAVIEAVFISPEEDYLSFDVSLGLPSELEPGEPLTGQLDIDSMSYPELMFRGLPPGLAYNAKTLTFSGSSNKPGFYRIQAEAVNASGYRFSSFADLHVANTVGQFISSTEERVEIEVGEYFHKRFDEMFVCEQEISSITLTGVPSGLIWDSELRILYGTPIAPEDVAILATVKYATGRSESASFTLSVVGRDPSDYDVDLSCLDGIQVGDEFDPEIALVATEADDAKIVSMLGLPTGLSAKRWAEDDELYWGISGRALKPGLFRVCVKVDEGNTETQRVVEAFYPVTVTDVPQQYLRVISADSKMGSVTGGGPVTPRIPVTISAAPRPGKVFAGWVDEYGDRLSLEDGTDYRVAKVTLPAEHDYFMTTLTAQFADTAEDVAPEISGFEDEDFVELESDAFFEKTFSVTSLSLPKLKFTGLPEGVSFRAAGTGEYILLYEPETAKKKPTPGIYEVTVTAENLSRRKSSLSFRMKVANLSDDRIRIEDDYGELTPGVPMESILLADAVDFDRGETLAVSGLPKGLTYSAKANDQKGIPAHSITGTPTVPGYYTLSFSANVVVSESTNAQGKVVYKYEKAMATAFLTVLPYPELIIDLDDEAVAAGCKVSGAGRYKAETTVTLKATAGKGWSFAGWDGLENNLGWLESLNPVQKVRSGWDDTWIAANFIPYDEDYLFLSDPELSENGYAAELIRGEDVSDLSFATLIADLIDTMSLPKVTVAGLPSGIKFSSDTFLLSGKPTKSGIYHVKVTAKNASGYSQIGLFDVAVLTDDGELPEEPPLVNEAEIDFDPWAELMTGVPCEDYFQVIGVPMHPETGADVKKVSVSGLPTGLKADVRLLETGDAEVGLVGVPTKPGRYVVSVSVSYVAGKSTKAQGIILVRDGGSAYLSVLSGSSAGTVNGTGVYAAGQTVKVSAKASSGFVFAGWAGTEQVLAALESVDLRSPTASFVFPAYDYSENLILTGYFVSAEEDRTISVLTEDEVWTIQPDEPSDFAFSVNSVSLPKVTVKGLPKGVKMDLARQRFTYDPSKPATPGIYTVTLSVKNATVTKAQNFTFEIRVANETSDEIGGLNPDMDAYPLTVGVMLDPSVILPQVNEGWALSVKGLPSGLTYRNGVISGTPTKAGISTVTFVATTDKGADRQTEQATITLQVAALPSNAVGTYNGVVEDEQGVVGTLTVSATSVGRISARLKMPNRQLTFSSANWETLTNGVLKVSMEDRTGSRLMLNLNTEADWTAWQLNGEVELAEGLFTVSAQRNSFGAKDGAPEAKEALEDLVGAYDTPEGVKLKVAKGGTVTISGKYDGKSVSGSFPLQFDTNFFVEYVKILDKNSTLLIVIEYIENNFVITSVERHILNKAE